LLAEMANQEHLDILANGVEAWNAWRRKNPDARLDLSCANLLDAYLGHADLKGADLSHASLSRAFLGGAGLSGAGLSGANLNGANVNGANVNGADLSRADLIDADLSHTDLSRADLSGAVLIDANLNGANLTRANLRDARMWRTVFGDVDLSTVNGLDTVRHEGPSTVGLDTIYKSKGKIPEIFLRGAGVPENFITYMKSLTGAALDFYSCFISYSTKDQEFADRLYTDLQARGVRCWFAPHDIKAGKKIHEQIDEAVKVYDKLLLILSDASMESKWVKTEIANARGKEAQQKRQMLFPISLVPFDRIKGWKLFDADTGIDSAREIREYFVPDFSGWKDHDIYAKAFDRLVRSLKADSARPASEAAL
jgi:uncharacterized protein YjbI with pentapeptide repeats